ncbi:thiamine pyrophosphate-dependent enzyme [Nocardioides sp. L-11A]|uniref:thiamine pyrophosphate-dependent enzyme n=1 Tax=Nocardioides sp. L-11A TaxID=3043848 RepID=UPI00249B00C9|nr:thiamine pyrophosphate-dependent enzyme [Nocardioides sp. L-11A]
MIESIDEYVVRRLAEGERPGVPAPDDRVSTLDLLALFDAQVQSRHLDLAARWLQSRGEGFYTIGSAGHESNAAVAMALRPSDPALLHYRSGGFYAARAAQVPGATPVADVLAGMATAVTDPISGGRHKVFGHPGLSIIPQTSTIGSHLPRAVGLAFSLGRAHQRGVHCPWPEDAVVVGSLGDASANHSTSVGALNSAGWCAHQGVPLPLLVVCEDNGIGISTRTPSGWTGRALSALPGLDYATADGSDPAGVLVTARELVETVRTERRPAVLHLRTVRFMGHAGSDAELAYRSRTEILADYDRDPVLATADALIARGALTPASALERYESARRVVMTHAESLLGTERLDTAERVMAPIAYPQIATATPPPRGTGAAGGSGPGLTLAQAVNTTLAELMRARPRITVFGEDVATKGGVYGVTRGLRKAFGSARVFDTLLDEQTILGTALGAALAGLLPIPEIQYLAYLHNAEDQLRGEAATLAFFSDGQYRNGMVVRIAGLAYQRGFGGHFHNDNSVAVLRDIPGLVLAVPSHPADAAELLATCVALAEEGRVCVFLEPIALYHTRDLHEDGDRGWLAAREVVPAATAAAPREAFGRVRLHGEGRDLLIVTFGNGVPMSLRAARRLAGEGAAAAVLDLRWLAPLPAADLISTAAGFGRVLIVDETRHSGGVSEGVLGVLHDAGHPGSVARVNSHDSFIPLGPAAEQVLLGEDAVVAAARRLMRTSSPASR